jgi:type VI secretion system ImpC/EvpB family protein
MSSGPAITRDAEAQVPGPPTLRGGSGTDQGALDRRSASGVLDSALDQAPGSPDQGGRLEGFLSARSPLDALRAWFGSLDGLSGRAIVQRLSVDIATIDSLLNAQINAILHHPQFQKLEASWRGLHYLVECAANEGDPKVKIKVLNCSWRELERDVESALEFDQSQMFRKVYDDQFGTAGGEPFGLLIGDYEIHPSVSASHPHDDVSVLGKIAGVAAAAFCPFIASASPSVFDLDSFEQLDAVRDLERGFGSPAFLRWRALRDAEDSRFVGLVLPHVLMRAPYSDDGSRVDRFEFVEDVAGPDRGKYLWGSAAYSMGETVIRSFAQTGWLAGIRGVQRDIEGGGLVCRLPVSSFNTDRPGIALQGVTDMVITDQLERELSDLGFIPLCQCHDREWAAFYSCQSIQKAKRYDRPAPTQNARISTMLHYMLCTSRFAHYLKILAREKIGSHIEADDCEIQLNRWIANYVTPDDRASPESKARYPLREAHVEVREVPGKPGSYASIIHLRPHFELDDLTATVSFRTELASPTSV